MKNSTYLDNPRASKRTLACSNARCGPTATPPETIPNPKLASSVRSSYRRFRSLSGTEKIASTKESPEVEREGAKIRWSSFRKLSITSAESWYWDSFPARSLISTPRLFNREMVERIACDLIPKASNISTMIETGKEPLADSPYRPYSVTSRF
ncbi:hypothetical protein D3C74_311390 [compost metagenome]